MKLIKINTNHYVVVNDSEIKEGDWYVHNQKGVGLRVQQCVGTNLPMDSKKITHSTQPIEEWKSISYGGDGTVRKKIYDKIKPLSLLEVKSLIGELVAEKRADDYGFQVPYDGSNTFYDKEKMKHYLSGYKQALEDNKERKYTEEDMIEWAMCMIAQYVHGNTNIWNKDLLRESLPKPKTEWDVEFVDGEFKLK